MTPVTARLPSRRWITCALAFALAFAVVAVPLWSVAIPPMLDYPNHLARQYILASLDESPYLQKFYVAQWSASPYMAMDVTVQAFAHVFPIEVAGRLFVTWTLLLMAAAPLALSKANFGRVTPLSLLGLLFVHNTTVSLGFVNYLFGVGFGLCLFALWIAWREGPTSRRIVVFPLLATLLFFSHALGFMVYGLCAASYELGRHVALVASRRPRMPLLVTKDQAINALSLIGQLLLPLSIYLLFGSASVAAGDHTYGEFSRKIDLLVGMVGYLMPPYVWRLDAAMVYLIPGGLLLLWLLRGLEFARPMLWPLAAVLAVFFAMPVALFGGWGADHRLLPVISTLLLGSLRLGPAFRSSAVWIAAAITALVIVRVTAVTLEWRKADEEYAEYLQAFDVVDDGSKLYFAFGEPKAKQLGRRPYQHMPTLVLMKKHVLVPRLFVAKNAGWIPLQYTPDAERTLDAATTVDADQSESRRWTEITSLFDFILVVDDHLLQPPAAAEATLVFRGQRVSLYRTRAAQSGLPVATPNGTRSSFDEKRR